MKFTADETVTKRMQALSPAKFVLDFDHTLSEDLEAIDSCAGGISRYRIVAVDDVPDVFDAHMDSDFGPIYYKGWGKIFFHEDLTARVEGSFNLMILKTPGEYLSNNLLVVDFKGKKVVA